MLLRAQSVTYGSLKRRSRKKGKRKLWTRVLTCDIDIEVAVINGAALRSCARQAASVHKSSNNSEDGSDTSKREHAIALRELEDWARSRCEIFQE